MSSNPEKKTLTLKSMNNKKLLDDKVEKNISNEIEIVEEIQSHGTENNKQLDQDEKLIHLIEKVEEIQSHGTENNKQLDQDENLNKLSESKLIDQVNQLVQTFHERKDEKLAEREARQKIHEERLEMNRKKGSEELLMHLKNLIPGQVKRYADYGKTEARVYEFTHGQGLKMADCFVKDLLSKGSVIKDLQSWLDEEHCETVDDKHERAFLVYFNMVGRSKRNRDDNKFAVFVNWKKSDWSGIIERLERNTQNKSQGKRDNYLVKNQYRKVIKSQEETENQVLSNNIEINQDNNQDNNQENSHENDLREYEDGNNNRGRGRGRGNNNRGRSRGNNNRSHGRGNNENRSRGRGTDENRSRGRGTDENRSHGRGNSQNSENRSHGRGNSQNSENRSRGRGPRNDRGVERNQTNNFSQKRTWSYVPVVHNEKESSD
jgi:hypothetical protein